MPDPRGQAMFGRRFARHVARLVRVYWTSPDAKWGALLLIGAIALELGTIYASVRIARAEGAIMDAIERKDPTGFLAAIGIFIVVSLTFLLSSTYRLFVRSALEIRWRRGLTIEYVERWMDPRAYALSELHRGELDNPDQRVAEDIRDFVASALGLSLSFLSAVVTLAAFGGMLWSQSRTWELPLGGGNLRIPGTMLWVALLFAGLTTWVTHLVGRRLVPINIDRLHYEADFRYGLVRFRDSIEGVSLARGELSEREGTLKRFRSVIRNWWQLITAQRNLTLWTMAIGQANGLVPLLVAAPAYFAGHITLGSIVQVRYAYGQVSSGLSWFVNAYQEIARWRANVERLSVFSEVMDTTAREVAQGGVRIQSSDASLELVDLRLTGRDGRVLVEHANASVAAGDRVVITGPSGSGKTVLIRAIAGLWPFGSGRIEVPTHAFFLPQHPYLPIGSLRSAASFPSPEGGFSDARIREALSLVALQHLTTRLDDVEQWEQFLTPHEQQRIALARVFLHEPHWVFLDKATSALDEDMERRVYELLAQRLPHTTVISIAHRPAVERYHGRRWVLAPGEDGKPTLRAA